MFVLLVQVFQVINFFSTHRESPVPKLKNQITLGLRCAEVLIKKGVKVSILEGRDRVGGRVGYNLHGVDM